MKTRNDLDTLSKRIESELGNKLRTKTPYGWSLIPNCKEIQIETKELEPRWWALGILCKYKSKITIKPHNNRGINKYIIHQCKRLKKNTNNPKKFWTIAWWIMLNSVAFRVSAINKVFPNWYKNLPFWTVFNINKKAQTILEKKDDNLIYKRVYIPKGETYRPLGVPSPEWRLVLHMFNNMMTIFLKDQIPSNFHGFVPNKGTLTAWRELSKMINMKYIYEFDLKQFFPSVPVNEVTKKLLNLGIPKTTVYWLENLNRCNPELPNKHHLDESRYILAEQDQIDIKQGTFRWESKLYNGIRSFIQHNGIKSYQELFGTKTPFEVVQEQWAIYDHFNCTKVTGQFDGLPQGAPTSPLLSILMLTEFSKQQTSIFYADDGIFASNKPFQIKDDPNLGINIHPGK